MLNGWKKATEVAKTISVVVVFVCTLGSALYGAWFRPEKDERVDDAYAVIRARLSANEAMFYTAVQELADTRAQLAELRSVCADKCRNDSDGVADAHAAATMSPLADMKATIMERGVLPERINEQALDWLSQQRVLPLETAFSEIAPAAPPQ